MKKRKFSKKVRFMQVKYGVLSGISGILAYVFMFVFLLFTSYGIMLLTKNVSNNPLTFSSLYDWIFVLIWCISGVFPVLLMYLLRNTRFKIWSSFLMFPTSVFIATLVPVFFSYSKVTPKVVKEIIANTNIFYWVMLLSLLIGWGITLFISREMMNKTNWWIFVTALPYILTFFELFKNRQNVQELLNFKDFSYKSVAAMISSTNGDLRLINPMWFTSISLIIFSFIFILGGVVFGIIWTKTKKWREKAKEIRKERKALQNTN